MYYVNLFVSDFLLETTIYILSVLDHLVAMLFHAMQIICN